MLWFGWREVEAENDVWKTGLHASIRVVQLSTYLTTAHDMQRDFPIHRALFESRRAVMGARALRIHQRNLKQLKGTLTACSCLETTTTYHIPHSTDS